MALNDRLQDAQIGHNVDLQRYSNWLVRRIIGLLNRVDSDLFAALTVALEKLPAGELNVERLESLLASVRKLNAQAYKTVGEELSKELKGLAEVEAGFQYSLFESEVPAQVIGSVGLAKVNLSQVEAAVRARPFQGRLLKEWAQSMEAGRMVRIRDAVRIGYTEQQTIDQIVRRLRGTRARGYADGLLEIDRRNAQAIVRTAVSHTAAVSREAFYDANTDLIKARKWDSTLDSRTTPICQVRDGKLYEPVSHKPIGHSIPWLGGPGRAHWGCRSVDVPVTKSWRELGLDIDEAPASTRASMDGQVPAETTYGAWLQRQSAARQDDVLGPNRAGLMRKGEVKFDQLFDSRGQFLTLAELQQRV
jgi:BMFP domain-containing protein YqiC